MQSIIESFIASESGLQVLRFLLCSSLLLGGALLIDKLRLIRQLSLLSWLWHGALTGSLLMLIPFNHPLGFTLLFRTPSPTTSPVNLEGTEIAVSSSVVALGSAVTSANLAQIMLILWVVGSATLLLRLFITARKEYASVGNRSAVNAESPMFKDFVRLSQSLGIKKVPRLSFSDSLVSAVTLPFREVCLPADLAQRDPHSIRSVLAHELSHIKQHDIPRLMTLQLLTCIFFFQPLLRVARDRLADIAEFQADRRAVALCDEPQELARALLTCADRLVGKQRSAMCYSMQGNPSRLRLRIEQIMGRGQYSTQSSGMFPRVMMITAIIAIVAFAPVFYRGPALLAAEIGPADSLSRCDSYHYELVVDAVHKGRVSGEQGLALWEQYCGTESGDIIDTAGKQYGLGGHHLWYMAKIKPMSDPFLNEVFKHGDALELSLFRNWHLPRTLPSDSSTEVRNHE